MMWLFGLVVGLIPASILTFGGGLLAVPFIAAFLRIFASVVEILSPIFRALLDLSIWYVKKFIEGVGIIFNNYTTLLVIGTLLVGTAWYQDNGHRQETRELQSKIKVLEKRPLTCALPKNQRAPYKGGIVRKAPDKVNKPFSFQWPL